MIADVPLDTLFKSGRVEPCLLEEAGAHAAFFPEGCLVRHNGLVLPLIIGMTSVAAFAEVKLESYANLLANASLTPTRRLSNAVYMNGAGNYYHFLVLNAPALLFLGLFAGAQRVTLATSHGIPENLLPFMARLIPALAGGRPVDLAQIDEGTYALNNVYMPLRPSTRAIQHRARRIILPFILRERGLSAPMAELGPLKLYMRRVNHGGVRNLANQDDIESWFVRHGYTSVDPGALSFEEQVVLFARATHIAGPEGAAFTNVLFAVDAVQVVMIGNPVTRSENFIPALVKNTPTKLVSVYGETCGAANDRNADYYLPIATLEAAVVEA